MGATGKFNPNEWRTLQFAPFWILSSLAGVHRNFDPSEVEGFSRSLDNAAKARGRLAREVIASVSENRDWLLEEFERDRRTIAGRTLCGCGPRGQNAHRRGADVQRDAGGHSR
jgi:hypothetical protein